MVGSRHARGVDLVDPILTKRPSGGRHRRMVFGLAAAIAAVGAILVVGDDLGGWWAGLSETLASPEAFRAWVEGLGAWGPIGYLLAQAAQVIVVPIPGTLFPPVGALAFGPWPALALSLAGMALGSAVVFLVARRWGRPLAIRLAGAERVQRYQSLMTARGGLLIWLVFLLPFLPDDAVCALAGLSGIGFGRFMLIATLGRIPAVAAGVFTMAGLQGAPAWVWAMAAAGFVIILWAGARFGPAIERRLFRLSRAPRTDSEETGRASKPSSVPPVPGSGHRPRGPSRAPHPDVS
jgi:uncharacterized membrane protein YdjX (TVP38/TMEM64 family)